MECEQWHQIHLFLSTSSNGEGNAFKRWNLRKGINSLPSVYKLLITFNSQII